MTFSPDMGVRSGGDASAATRIAVFFAGTLHRRISMEQAEQKSVKFCYCSHDQRQSTSILEFMGRVFQIVF